MAMPAGKEVPKYTIKELKLMGVSSRLQTIMINENLTPGELVGCAESVRNGYQALKCEGMTAVDGELRCSFCNVPRAEAKKLVVGLGNVCICDKCVWLCVGILKPDTEAK
ncbi:hypothetical protein Dpoa569_0001406 [Dickeya poaceiphila]|uniref:ClpX-type ZB domain-containing protein n=2 Tax=Pectobacteriaceae TaxID=1903410 RepID=A0A5B8I6J9_9GAMM|nr:hypothetical protein Dpoa569_0001406 [Dickeya poaceiphila]